MPEHYSQIGEAVGAAMAHNARMAADAAKVTPTDRPETPRLDVLIDRACRHLTPDEGAALRAGWAGLERAREERGTYQAAWHSARDRARKHRAAVDDMWDANTRLAQRARRAEKQLATEQAEHRQAHEQETANTAAEITRAERAEQQLQQVLDEHTEFTLKAGEQIGRAQADTELLRRTVRAECEQLQRETRGLNPHAMAGRRDAVTRVLAALDAAGQDACPGETDPPTCNCPCEGCQHHCAAHQPAAPSR